ncbi:helix-turn-helix transcriptional regulator [Paenibacillus nanensis]|uniref:Helix-turn-helix transcriptional regulator n=1 Tax=Paenibacillus nanensis TaxID=393251 RepID=A0A3A1V232_9BACL|nr:LuxR family transcriptional regulator [Paenibacillus nanensis]RIX53881.1 helix-turn-helix transcriptional regulator [Paenibacillus nanensis]
MKSDNNSHLAQSGMEDRERYFIVGREKELAHFQTLLTDIAEQGSAHFLHVYGTGGVGKSTFLRLCKSLAAQEGACFVHLESRDFVHTEQGITDALLRQLREEIPREEFQRGEERAMSDRERCTAAIGRIAHRRPVVIAFDTFEEMQDMETWLRERLFPMLPPRTIVLMAGRHPLKGSWQLSAVWRERLLQIPMKHLDKGDCREYLRRCGITEDVSVEHVWRLSKGHPLTLSLAAAAESYQEDEDFAAGTDWFEEVAALWLKEVPDGQLRTVVEAACVLRHFNQELLSYVLEEEVAADVFDRLTQLSFVRKSERGWQLHDLMRETTCARLKERTPGRYKRLCERSAAYYADAILAAAGRRSSAWEYAEFFRYVGASVLRALTDDAAKGSYYWETITETSLAEAKRYIEMRQKWPEPVAGVGIDPVTGAQFRIEYSIEEIRYNVALLDIEAIYRLEPTAIKLLRDSQSGVHGIAVFIPIHAGTLSFMEKDPISRPFFASLSAEEKQRLMTPREQPEGWFMRVMDFSDVMNPDMRSEVINLMNAYFCSGGIVVCSPYPSGISREAYPGFGFSVVAGAAHYHYDGKTEAPTYALDTRGDKLRSFLEGMFRKAGLEWQAPQAEPAADISEGKAERRAAIMKKLTKREQQVAELVLAGYSNLEAAQSLYVSEVTVKKHLMAIYTKLNIHSRMQLAGMLHGD